MPPFMTVLGDSVNVKESTGGLFKHLEQGSVEAEVVTTGSEEIIPGE